MTPEFAGWAARLAAKVREMRVVQTRYFRNKQYHTLAEARRLEREVDAILAELDQPTLDVGR